MKRIFQACAFFFWNTRKNGTVPATPPKRLTSSALPWRRAAAPLALIASAITANASVDNGLLSLAPATAQLFVGVDVQKTKSSDFGQFLLSKSQTDDLHFQQFMDKTGFDPRRDLQSMLLVGTGNPDAAKGQSAFAVLARGVFDQSKITTISKDGVSQTFNGVSMTVYPNKGQSLALAFPETGVAVMADLATMKQIIQNLATPTSFDPALLARINAVGAANDAWFVSTTGPSGWPHNPSQSATGRDPAQALQSIRSASGGMHSGATVDLSFDATARSPQDATSLADVFRFMASTVQMQRQSQNNPGIGVLAASMDNMTLTTAGNTVHIAFSVPEKSLEQLAAAARPKQK
jgi:hypothetical protein